MQAYNLMNNNQLWHLKNVKLGYILLFRNDIQDNLLLIHVLKFNTETNLNT